ncbi:hypothetical protein EGW08_000599 [Elysia chlorotica]|uniref:Uncharacterized protein n=1 Tax=Elysia chlorotica TaxID=188477 RepID=A0A433UCU2_ELYCH|nr:hypothetical protein EGW08_000599 [Elysia chlorotica]
MASGGEITLDEKQPQGYAVRPSDARSRGANKPMMRPGAHHDLDDDSKVSFSCQNGTLKEFYSSRDYQECFILQTIAVGAPYWSAGWRRDKMSWHEGTWMTCYRLEMDNKWVCAAYDYSSAMSWHEGTWMTCYRLEMDNKWICAAYDYSSATPGLPGWYTFCQAMGLISIVIFLPALLINFFYTMHPKGKMFRGLLKFNFILTFATALLPLLMIIVWAAGHPRRDRFPISYSDEDHDDDPFEFHFSFYFEILAFLVSLGAFVLEIFDFRQNGYYE